MPPIRIFRGLLDGSNRVFKLRSRIAFRSGNGSSSALGGGGALEQPCKAIQRQTDRPARRVVRGIRPDRGNRTGAVPHMACESGLIRRYVNQAGVLYTAIGSL